MINPETLKELGFKHTPEGYCTNKWTYKDNLVCYALKRGDNCLAECFFMNNESGESHAIYAHTKEGLKNIILVFEGSILSNEMYGDSKKTINQSY